MRLLHELSAFREGVAPWARAWPLVSPPRGAVPILDACQVGVVLRAVAWTEALAAVAVMFGARSVPHWLERLAMVSAGVLPAVLAWLILACLLGRRLARRSALLQQVALTGLGAGAGLQACAFLAWNVPGPGGASWLAAALAGALLAGSLVAAHAWRERARAPADAAARLSALQARIEPHFLFNSLNAAIALVRQDPARAEGVLEDLADLFRQALADPAQAVPLSDELALARRYLRIEQVRFGDRLQVRWTIDPRAGDARVPPLLLQPLVENAVRHGVEPCARGALVHVRTERRGGRVVITVANTVPAGRGLVGRGMALRNVRERLHLLHDVHCHFTVRLRAGVFQVRMEVPA